MKVEYLKAQNKDFDELVDLINYVFSHDGGRTDLPSLLPKLYKHQHQQIENHYIVKENGKIKAVVGVFPMNLELSGQLLKCSGIGSVAVHPYSRGRGYMKQLMNMALEDMKSQGVHMSCLGGKRQRYEYFGFTLGGQKVSFEINQENIRHRLKHYYNEEISFNELKQTNIETINQAYRMYNQEKFKFIRDESSFFDLLKSWSFKVYSIHRKEQLIGYIVVDQNKSYISELILESDEDFLEVLVNYVRSQDLHYIKIEIPMWEKKKIRQLNVFAEETKLEHSYQFNILNYEETIKLLLDFKASYSPLMNGMMSFEILDYGKFQICVENNQVQVTKIEEECMIRLSHIEAMQVFLSPFGSYVLENNQQEELIHSWFPLPLFMPTQDKI